MTERQPSAFERAAEIVARRLASFRLGLDADDPFAYNDYEMLCAGHIVGALWGQKLLNTEGENWVTVESDNGEQGDGHGMETQS